jgi:aspartate/methionine/tyrosine aminotransferase
VLVVNPNNPTGSFLHQDEFKSLIACVSAPSLALIADEVFSDFVLEDDTGATVRGDHRAGRISPEPSEREHAPHWFARTTATMRVRSVAATREALTFTLSGLSKISALPQMKLAWIVVNGPADAVRDALVRLELIADTYLSVSAPLAWALPRLLETRRAIQPQIIKRARGNLRCLDHHLASCSAVTRLSVEGGWYAVLRLPAIRTDEEWAVKILQREGVLSHPGHFYDFPSEGHLVVSLLPRPEVFEQGVDRILRCVIEHL